MQRVQGGGRGIPGAAGGYPGFVLTRRDFLHTGLAVLAGPALAGCGDATAPGPRPVLSARPVTPAFDPEYGLSPLGLDPSRDGLLYVPDGYAPGTPAPLFVALHGAGGSASNWTSYYARADARDFVLLAPSSRSRTWDFLLGGYGPDVTFLDRALQHTFERVLIDPARIALGGFSDGASYALSLGASNGDLFTHLVGYSPGFFNDAGPTPEKPRIFISHGTQDPILPVGASRNDTVPLLRKRGYDVTYREFDGGHLVPAEISEAALDWFLEV